MKAKIITGALICTLVSCNTKDAEKIVNKTKFENVIEVPQMRNIKDVSTFQYGTEMVNQNNQFSFNSFEKINTENDNKNFMYSPVSLSLALAMVYNGADGTTKEAFDKVLGYNAPLDEVNKVNQNLIQHLSNNEKSTFKIANSIWTKKGFPVKQNFIDLNVTNYYAEVTNVDFLNQNSIDMINDWVSQKTNDKIKSIIEKGSNPELLLLNAIYFQSNWETPFSKDKTKKRDFTNSSGKISVDMMNIEETLKYQTNNTFSSVKLDYKNNEFDLTVIVPNEGRNTTDVVDYLKSNDDTLEYSNEVINLMLPKFKFSFTQDLNRTLKELGLSIAFDGEANFSKISQRDLQIGKVIQKTFIDLNEKGTEAAAVTAIGMITTSNPVTMKPIDFKANKPFVFMITHKKTNAICFMGKVDNPNK